jgi:hypothetical protein
MATKAQYEVFRGAYEEENERHSGLESRAKLYLTIITAYLGAVAFKTTDVLAFLKTFDIPFYWYLLLGICLILALLLAVCAMGIRKYEGVFDAEAEIKSFGDKPPADEDFFDKRIVDLAVATNRNSAVNNRIATYLQWSGILVFVAVCLQLIVFGLAILCYRSISS